MRERWGYTLLKGNLAAALRATMSIQMAIKRFEVTDPKLIELIMGNYMEDEDLYYDIYSEVIEDCVLESVEHEVPEGIHEYFSNNEYFLLASLKFTKLVPYALEEEFLAFIDDLTFVIEGISGGIVEMVYLPTSNMVDNPFDEEGQLNNYAKNAHGCFIIGICENNGQISVEGFIDFYTHFKELENKLVSYLDKKRNEKQGLSESA